MQHTFEAIARQRGKVHEDGSGETFIWTDGLLIGTMDHRQDNLTPVKLKCDKMYRVTVIVEEIK